MNKRKEQRTNKMGATHKRGVEMIAAKTGRKRTGEELKISERQFRALIENAQDAIVIVNPDITIRYESPSMARMTGRKAEDRVGKNPFEYCHPDDSKKVTEEFTPLLENKIPIVRMELRLQHENGKFLDIELIGTNLVDDPAVGGIVLNLRDITESKRAEEELKQQTHVLNERLKELGCLYGISELVNKKNISLGEMFQGAVDLIPTGWQHTEITCARIALDGQEFRTENFRETIWKQTQDIIVYGNRIADVEVFYLEERPEIDEGPFLKEERLLIGEIARSLGEATERRRLEELLQRSEKHFRTLVETMNDGMAIQGADGVITFVNDKLCQMLGYTSDELIGHTMLETFYKVNRGKYKEQIGKRGKGVIAHYEIEVNRKDGSRIVTRVSPQLITDAEGNILGSFGIVTDVTEHKGMEEALRKSEERFRSLVENAPYIIMITDREGKILFINYTISGYSVEDTIGTSVYDYISVEHHDEVMRTIQGVFESGEPAAYEIAGAGPDGTTSWYSTRLGPIKHDEHVIAMTHIIMDITEQRRAEEALRESEEKYRLLIESSNAAITFFDENGTYLFLNSIAAGWLNGKPEDYMGKTVHDMFPKDLADMFAERHRRIVKSGVGETIEEIVEPLKRCISSNLQPVRNQEGKVIGVQIVTYDITERKRAEEELWEKEERLSAFMESATDSFTLWDSELNLVEINKVGLDLFPSGTRKEDVIARNLRDLVPGDEKTGRFKRYLEVIKTGEPFLVEDVVASPIFGSRCMDVRAFSVGNGMGIIARDIAERKLIEERLRRSEQNLKNAQKMAHLGHWEWDISTNKVELSEEAKNIFGFKRDVVDFNNQVKIIHPEDIKRIRREIKTARTGKTSEIEFRINQPGGDIKWILAKSDPLTDEDDGGKKVFGYVMDITVRKRAEEELLESKEKLSRVFDSIEYAVIISDMEGKITDENEAALGFQGYSRKEEVIGRWGFEFISEKDRLRAIQEGMAAIERGYGSVEAVFVTKDGKEYDAETNATLLRDASGNPIGFVSITRDVTERKRMEESLKDSEETLKQAQHLAQVGSWTWNLKDNSFVLSDELSHIYGTKESEFKSFEDIINIFIHPDDRKGVFKAAEKVTAKGYGGPLVYRIIRTDGEVRWMSATIPEVRQFDINGNPEVMVGAVQDITERIQAEQQVRDSEERLKAFMESATDFFSIWDSNLNLLHTTVRQVKTFFPTGTEKEDLMGKNIIELAPNVKETGQYYNYLRVIETGKPFSIEETVPDPMFGDHHLSLKAFKVGEGMGLVLTDITERKKAKEELQRYSERLRAMAARLSSAEEEERRHLAQELHDQVGQYLTALSINLSRAGTQLSDESAAPVLSILNDSQSIVEQMSEVIRNIMANLRPPVIEDYGLVAAIRWYAGRFTKRTGIDVTVEGEEPSPRLSSPYESALYRVAQEVFTNIAKHAQATRVSVNVAVEGEKVRLLITDDGIGFDTKEVDMSNGQQGWGLVIMSERVRSMGGSFNIESRPGHGTRVTVEVEK